MTDNTSEYVVCLHAGVDAEEFWSQMECKCEDHSHVPHRPVDVANERPGSKRICHYVLTQEEAQQLNNDERVLSVELPIEAQPHVQLRSHAVQRMNYEKTSASSSNLANWALARCVSDVNNYGLTNNVSTGFPYTLTGQGVDVIITDSGLQVDHPEFDDEQGTSRVQLINWYEASGVSGTQSPLFYRDWDGHGTHVAGIVAGVHHGWAKHARIYAIKIAGLEGAGDAGSGMSVTDCMDVIQLWHSLKPVDELTGHRRPTVVNMSWGLVSRFENILGGSYRGAAWTGTSPRRDLGMIGADDWFGVRNTAIDVAVGELIDAGIHVCISAGNSFQKIDTPLGVDYNNSFTRSGVGSIFYHRGSSPFESRAVRVGSTDTLVRDETTEYKSTFSDGGAGVDLWAPGSNIVSACSNTNQYGGAASTYFADASFVQANISGTSMSAPQVAGVISLYLELNPWATPAQAKSWLVSQSKTVIYQTGSDEDYETSRSLWGSSNRFLYVPFNSAYPISTQGSLGLNAVRL
jgi:subtilisin family serine protease